MDEESGDVFDENLVVELKTEVNGEAVDLIPFELGFVVKKKETLAKPAVEVADFVEDSEEGLNLEVVLVDAAVEVLGFNEVLDEIVNVFSLVEVAVVDFDTTKEFDKLELKREEKLPNMLLLLEVNVFKVVDDLVAGAFVVVFGFFVVFLVVFLVCGKNRSMKSKISSSSRVKGIKSFCR